MGSGARGRVGGSFKPWKIWLVWGAVLMLDLMFFPSNWKVRAPFCCLGENNWESIFEVPNFSEPVFSWIRRSSGNGFRPPFHQVVNRLLAQEQFGCLRFGGSRRSLRLVVYSSWSTRFDTSKRWLGMGFQNANQSRMVQLRKFFTRLEDVKRLSFHWISSWGLRWLRWMSLRLARNQKRWRCWFKILEEKNSKKRLKLLRP